MDGTAEVNINKTTSFICDEEDLPIISQYKWVLHKGANTSYVRGYKRGESKKPYVYLHRVIMNASKGEEVDHKNRNGLDNRKSNLRICTHGENAANRDNIKGYWFDKTVSAYRAEIWFNNKKKYIGVFKHPEEARLAYLRKKEELYPHFEITI